MALTQSYYELWFETFRLIKQSGHLDPIQLKLVAGQRVPKEIDVECASRCENPFELLTECSRSLLNDYPVGTKFHLKAKLTDLKGGGLFFYTYHGWKPFEIIRPSPR